MYDIISSGDRVNNNFMITEIHRAVFVGEHEYPGSKIEFTHTLKYQEIVFHLSGVSTLRFNGNIFNIEKDTVRFLPKCTPSEYIVEKAERGDCIAVAFDTDVPVSEEAFTVKVNENTKIKNMFKKLFSVWVSKNAGYYFECVSLLYNIFAELQKQDYLPQKTYNKIKPAIEYIEENFLTQKISVSNLAEKCKISEAYLKKLFIKRFGVPPAKYIIQLKINYACDLLLYEKYSITQVAEICGYENIYYFSRQFKKYMGITPTDFIKKYKSSR